MAKGQKRSNREAKKPKQSKPEGGGAVFLAVASGSAAHERTQIGRRDQTSGRNGRK
jgi:hypothetical protein